MVARGREVLFGIILLVDLVLVAYLVDKCSGRMQASLAQLADHFRQGLSRPWVPPIGVKEGLLLPWQEVRSAVVDGSRPSLALCATCSSKMNGSQFRIAARLVSA